jgi:acylglycerol lipase
MHLFRKNIFSKPRWALASLVAGLTVCALGSPALAEVERDDSPQLEGLNHRRVYEWKDTELKPKAVAIAVHGLVLHGGVYDKLARELAGQGFVVVAPDLRGYGRWCPDQKSKPRNPEQQQLDNATVIPLDGILPEEPIEQSCSSCKSTLTKSSAGISYEKSYHDLKDLVKAVRNHYPALPLYVIGESLGAGMALHLASDMPQSIDGIVLSSPAIKRRVYMEPRMVMDLTVMMLSPSKTVDVSPYIRRFASEDPQVADTALQDPLVRKKMKMVDLLKTSQLIKGNIRFASKIPEDMPVLIIQGDRDRMLKSNGVVTLLSQLRSSDQTVRWFPGKGHLLLETPHIMPETIETVSLWLENHVKDATRTKATILDGVSMLDGTN